MRSGKTINRSGAFKRRFRAFLNFANSRRTQKSRSLASFAISLSAKQSAARRSNCVLIPPSVLRIRFADCGGGGGIRRLIYGLKPESISLYWVFKQNQHLLRDCQNPPRRDTFRDTSEHTFSAMQASCSLHFSV